jgi:uncharacterized protein
LTGPGAGTDYVKTPADPTGRAVIGTFANCSGGVTAWGTVLSGEENFHSYFGAPEAAPKPSPVDADRLDRYGVALKPSELLWENFDPRFDVARTPNEVNRFGWVVEVNPWDPNSKPVKHTAMGRLKHEAATVYVTGDGTVVTYSGDDERFDYMYKFVSANKVQPGTDPAAMAHNLTLLDEGTLYVAKLTSDIPATDIDGSGKLPSTGSFSGSGTWIPLLRSGAGGQGESLVDGVTAQEAAVFTRLAADKAGATKMDRPEDFEANPKTGKLYVALTNNDKRGTAGTAPTEREQERTDPGDHRRPRRHQVHLGVAAGLRRSGGGRHLLRRIRQDEGQPDLLPGQPGVRQPRQHVDLYRRQRAEVQRRAVRRRARGAKPGRDQAVPDRAAGCRNVRPDRHRRPGHRVRAASRRG